MELTTPHDIERAKGAFLSISGQEAGGFGKDPDSGIGPKTMRIAAATRHGCLTKHPVLEALASKLIDTEVQCATEQYTAEGKCTTLSQ